MKHARILITVPLFVLVSAGLRVSAASDDDGWPRFRETYKELVETNTAASTGSCTSS